MSKSVNIAKELKIQSILDRVIERMSLNSLQELANILNISIDKLYQWRSRNTMDWPQVVSLIKEYDFDYEYILWGDSITNLPIDPNKKATDPIMQRAAQFLFEKFETISNFANISKIHPKLIYLYLYEKGIYADKAFTKALLDYGCNEAWLFNDECETKPQEPERVPNDYSPSISLELVALFSDIAKKAATEAAIDALKKFKEDQ